ncbi:MAG TPA: hypothetical protein VGS22_00225 [Thermoanaerobaculia bacterium]|jgi:hypothetical protein|nr:hypothetical protein [Thermoanaerobaculia bacterium]
MLKRTFPFVAALALLVVPFSGCDKLSSVGSGSKGDPETASAADTTGAKLDLNRKIEDKKAEIDRLNADLPNLTDEQAKIDAVNKMESLRQELNDLVDQRGRM